jgi:glycosyltransferase involved in cell wall biosynthesis
MNDDIRVVQVFRRRNKLFFSIENVFETIRRSWPYVRVPQIKVLPSHGISIRNLIFLSLRVKRGTIYHVTGDVHYAVVVLPRRRTILTIHDCVFLENYFGVKKSILKLILLDLPVWYTSYITTISAKTKQEIVFNTKCNPDKIQLIPNPVSSDIYFAPRVFNEERPVLLFLGVTANKNLERVCNAIQGIECLLLIIGVLNGSQINDLETRSINYENLSGLNSSEIGDMYARADIILFPSLYEGFGLPIIEGFKAGRVVITSDVRPMNDIADNAACLVDPLDVLSIRNGICKVIDDREYRENLIRKGFSVVQQYSPEAIAEKYYNLYQKVYQETCVE